MIRKYLARIEAFIRSFFIESSFNYESMQQWGFLFIFVPYLRKRKNDEKYLAEFENRHKSFINTHPYLVSFLAGAVLKIEEEHTDMKKETGISIDKFKGLLSQSLAVSGDRFFWKYLKPICAVLGILVIISNQLDPISVIIGSLLFLLSFNIPALFIRVLGFYLGYKTSKELLRTKVTSKLEKWNYYLCISGLFLIGLLVVFEANFVFLKEAKGLIVFLISFLISFYLNLKRKFPSTAIYVTMVLSIGIFYIIELIN